MLDITIPKRNIMSAFDFRIPPVRLVRDDIWYPLFLLYDDVR